MTSNHEVVARGLSSNLHSGLFNRIQAFLAPADIRINGTRDWDIQLYNKNTFKKILTHGNLGFAESYMNGWWDCKRLDLMFANAINAELNRHLIGLAKTKIFISRLTYGLFNRQTLARSFKVGQVHYDVGNKLYQKMLDPTMNYSCGYWKNANTLAQAQLNKMELICQKLKLQPGMSLLDIGCGWGSLAAYAAKNYGVHVTGITISKEQQKLAIANVQGLPVEIKLVDYRYVKGEFDRVVSVGLFEHVGPKNYGVFFESVKRLLKKDGLFLLHTIGEEITRYAPDPFLEKYIFPNGKIPSRQQINDASENVFRLEDWHNFGVDYDATLMAWAKNFEESWPEISEDYDDQFYRMWRYYLYSCAAFFRTRQGQLWQLVYCHLNNPGSYASVR